MKAAKNLAATSISKVIEVEDGVEIEFGGIYPFNTIRFNGAGIYKYIIHAFDGAKYYKIYEADSPEKKEVVHLDKTIDSSYRIKIETYKFQKDSNKLEPEVYKL